VSGNWSRVIECNPVCPDRSWCRQFLLPSALSPHSSIICPHLDQASNDRCRGQPVRGGRIADDTPETLGSVREVPRRRVDRTFGPRCEPGMPVSGRLGIETRPQKHTIQRYTVTAKYTVGRQASQLTQQPGRGSGGSAKGPHAAVSVLLGRSAGRSLESVVF
jgi:hypothetical protein